MPNPITGISKLARSPDGYTFLHAGGASMLRTGTPVYNAMRDMVDMSQLALAERQSKRDLRQAQKNKATPAPPPAPPQRQFSLNPFKALFGKPSAPASLRILDDPRHLSFASQSAPGLPGLPGQGSPTRPMPPTHGRYRDSALARRLGLAGPEHTGTPGKPMLLLHHWQIREGKDGLFLRGQIAGHPHFPDNALIETPYMKEYRPQENLFTLADGSIASLGHVRPGSEQKQAELLDRAQRALLSAAPIEVPPKMVPDVATIDVKENRVRIRFADHSALSSGLNEHVGLAFGNLVNEMKAAGISIAWKQGLQPPTIATPAAVPQKTAPQTPTPKHVPPQHDADGPEVPPVGDASHPEENVSFESLAPSSQSAAGLQPSDESVVTRMKIARVIDPKDGKDNRVSFGIQTPKGEVVVYAAPKIEEAMAAVLLSGLVNHAMVRLQGGNMAIETLCDDKGGVIQNEEVAKRAEEIRHRAAKVVASAPATIVPQVSIKAAAPAFRSITPPTKGPSGPELA